MAVVTKKPVLALELLTLPEVLSIFPVSRSLWYRGVQEGRFPRPVHLSERRVAWRRIDIETLLNKAGERANG